MRITAIGELLIDLTYTGTDPLGLGLYTACPGGAPANVAAACALLGAESAFTGRVGRDAFGLAAVEALRSRGVDVSGVSFDESAPTTLACVHTAPDGERSFSFYRDCGADVRLRPADVPEALIRGSRVLHFGSLSLTHPDSRAALEYAIGLARGAGALTSCDVNYRAGLWPDEKTAAAAMRSLLPGTDIVKLSAEELELVTGEADIAAGARRALEYGAGLLLITDGANGAYYANAAAFGRVAARKTRAVDTNGAGDSFMGAALTRLAGYGAEEIRSLSAAGLEEIVAFANRAAALTCTRRGAIPALPTAAELEEG